MSKAYRAFREFDENGVPLESIKISEFEPETRRLNREIEITGNSISIRWRDESDDWMGSGFKVTNSEWFEKLFSFIYESTLPKFKREASHKIYQYGFKNLENDKWEK